MKYAKSSRDQLERVRDLSFPFLSFPFLHHTLRVQRGGSDKSWTRSSWSLLDLMQFVGVNAFISPCASLYYLRPLYLSAIPYIPDFTALSTSQHRYTYYFLVYSPLSRYYCLPARQHWAIRRCGWYWSSSPMKHH